MSDGQDYPGRPREGRRRPTADSSPSALARGLQLSTELVAAVLVGAAIGWLTDRWLGISPWGMIVFLLLGFAAGVLNVMQAAGIAPRKRLDELDRNNEKNARTSARTQGSGGPTAPEQPMAIYMIGYDLRRSKENNYDKLFAALEAIGSGYWDCLDSTWLVYTERTPVQIRDELKQYLEDGDRLLVMRYGDGAAWLGFKDECQTWLEDNL